MTELTPTPSDAERAFVARAKATLAAAAAAQDEATLDATFRELAPRRRAWVPYLAVAALAAGVAVIATWLALGGGAGGGGQDVAAFDGGAAAGVTQGATVSRDERGRISEIATKQGGTYDGERMVFRAGRLARIEHWRDAQRDGVAVDFDGSGRVVRVQSWVAGAATGAWVELDASGKVKASGP